AELPSEGGVFGMPDEGENIKLHIIQYADLNLLFQSNRLCNAPIIMALQWLQQHVNQLENV
ncbi:MAG: NUDIX hydrolase, partial [Acinetobacter sp.]